MPEKTTIRPPPIMSATPISAKPTNRSETACANEFHAACSNAENSTATTIGKLTQSAPSAPPYETNHGHDVVRTEPAKWPTQSAG